MVPAQAAEAAVTYISTYVVVCPRPPALGQSLADFLRGLRTRARALGLAKRAGGGGELWSELGHYIRIQSSSYIRIWRRLGLAGRGPMFWRPLLSLFRLRSTPFWGSNKHLFSFSSLPVFSVVQCTETHDTRRARLPQLLSARVWASFLFRGLLSTSPSHPIISPNGDAERCGDAVLVAMVAVTAVARTVGRHAGAGAYISKHSTLRRYVSMPGAVAIVGEAPSI